MYLTVTNIFKVLFTGGFQEKAPVKLLDDEDHTYIRGAIENRGPCPGLNALANQGYLYLMIYASHLLKQMY
jgi:Peroxidase, family 2